MRQWNDWQLWFYNYVSSALPPHKKKKEKNIACMQTLAYTCAYSQLTPIKPFLSHIIHELTLSIHLNSKLNPHLDLSIPKRPRCTSNEPKQTNNGVIMNYMCMECEVLLVGTSFFFFEEYKPLRSRFSKKHFRWWFIINYVGPFGW